MQLECGSTSVPWTRRCTVRMADQVENIDRSVAKFLVVLPLEQLGLTVVETYHRTKAL